MFARSEDIANSYNKVFYVSPAGANAEGENLQRLLRLHLDLHQGQLQLHRFQR